jgi:hypothetical protein
MEIPLPQPLARPIYRETLAEFDAPDPWNQGRPVRWMLVIYQMSPGYRIEKFDLSASNRQGDLPQGHAVGLFARQSNEHHLLPYSLRRLWQQGFIRMETLPDILIRSEQAGVVDRELVPVGNYHRVASSVGLSIGLTMTVAGGVIWLLFARLEAAILCAATGLMIAGISAATLVMYWFWRRRQNRYTQHWLHLARSA